MLCLSFFVVLALGQRPSPTPPQRPVPPTAPGAARAGAGSAGGEPSAEGGPAVLAEGDVPQVRGALGDLPPRAEQLRRALPGVALDTTGHTRPEMAGLAALADGFAVLFSDERDGVRGCLLQRLDSSLEPSGALERIDPQPSGMGQGEAAFAVSSSGEICGVWVDALDRAARLRGRCWEADGSTTASAWSLPLPLPSSKLRAGASGGPGILLGPRPALVWTGKGCALAWNAAGRILLREIDPRTPSPQRADILGNRTEQAVSGPRLAVDAAGGLACAFDAGGAVNIFLRLAPGEGSPSSAGPGSLVGLAADDSRPEGGWWVLARRQGALALRHLARGGGEDQLERRWIERPWVEADLAVGAAGPCALVQFADGELAAHWFDPLAPEAPVRKLSLRPPGSASLGSVHAAARGERFVFVWSERSTGELELLAASCAAGGERLVGPRKLLPGEGSAVQEQPVVALAADRGVLAWTDHRHGDPVVMLRGLDASGAPATRELLLPAPFGPETASSAESKRAVAKRPALALSAAGRGLAAWVGSAAAGPAILVQAFDVDSAGELELRSAVAEVDPEPASVPTHFRPAVIALADERGFALVWVRSAAKLAAGAGPSEDGRSEMRIARLGVNGLTLAPPRTIGSGPRLARPCLVQLDDRRIAVAWEEQPQVGARRLCARILSERLELESRVLYFETMWRGSDYAPAIAPVAGGFALAWTSGEEAERDVFARAYDCQGRPLSRPVALSTLAGGQQLPTLARCADGSLVAVWQDDLSRRTRLVGRRIRFPTGALGPWVRFAFGPEGSIPDFATPQIAPRPEGGLLLVAAHAVRDKGREIGLCLVGPDWDHVEGR